MNNHYCKGSRISEKKIRARVRDFAASLTALQTAEPSGLDRNTVNRVYRALRKRLHTACQAQRPMFGVVEGDESLSGARRGKAKRGRGAVGKTTVFGLFAREGQVYAEVVPGCKKATLQGSIGGKADPAWVLTCDGWRGDNGLVDPSMGITGSILPRTHSPEAMFISRAWKAFGGWQRGVCQRSKVCQTTPFICRCKKLNGETTTGIPTDTNYG